MATGTAQPAILPPPPPVPTESKERERIIQGQLARTCWQLRLIDLASGVATWIIGVLVLFILCALVDHFVGLGFIGRCVALAVLLGGSLWYLAAGLGPLVVRAINPEYAARTIEEATPTLKNSLINFLLLRHERASLKEIVYQAVEKQAAADIATVPVEATVDRSRLIHAGYVLCVVLAIFAGYKIVSPKDPFQTVARVLAPWAEIARPSRVQISEVEPGSAEVYYGQSVPIFATVRGARDGDKVIVQYSTADGQTIDQAIEMKLSAGDRYECLLPPAASGPVAAGGLLQNVSYKIVAGDAETFPYRLTVISAPTIIVDRLQYQYPSYTGQAAESVSQQGDIKALEGTKVTVHALANQAIKSAWMELDPATTGGAAETIALAAEGERAAGTMTLQLRPDRQTPWRAAYQVRFYNERGQRSQQPILHRIEVIRDLAPEVQILKPERLRVEVPEDGEETIEVRAVDPDFRLTKLRIEGTVAGKPPLSVDLLEDQANQPPQITTTHAFRPREHGLKAGDELRYAAVAEDNRTSPLTGQPEPNLTRTKEYVLVVTAPRGNQAGKGAGERGQGAGQQNQQATEKAQKGEERNQQPMNDGGKGNQQQNGKANDQQKQNEQHGNQQQGDQQKGEPQQAEQQKSDQQKNSQRSSQPQQGQDQQQQQGGESKQNGAQQQGGGQQGEQQKQPQAGEQHSGNQSGDGQSADGQKGSGQESGSQPGQSGAKSGGQPGNQSTGESGQKGQAGSQQGEGQQKGEERDRAGAQSGGAKSRDESGKAEHDGQAIERIWQDLKDRLQNKPGKEQQQGGQQQQAGEKQQDGKEQGGQDAGGQSQSGGASGAQNQNVPNAGRPEGNDQKLDSQQGQRGQGKTGDANQRLPDDKEGQNSSQQKSGGNEGGAPRGASKTDKGEESSASKGEQRDPGAAKNSDEGAGQASENKSGSGMSDQKNQDRNKEMRPNSDKPQKGEPGAPSQSKKQSDSKGAESGDLSGGGKQGPGQSGAQEGNDSAGSKSAADQGAGKANETGGGETRSKAGEQQKAGGPTGKSGDQAGEGGQSREGKGTPGAGGKAEQGRRDASKPSQKGDLENAQPSDDGRHLVGGKDDGRERFQNKTEAVEEQEADAANLEYARKATEMVLKHLKEEEHNPDPELLEKLGWSKEDLAEFLKRWDALQKSADQSPDGKRELDEALKSLGLRDPANRRRAGGKVNDNQRDLRDAGNRSAPPPRYRELFDAFRKGAARSQP